MSHVVEYNASLGLICRVVYLWVVACCYCGKAHKCLVELSLVVALVSLRHEHVDGHALFLSAIFSLMSVGCLSPEQANVNDKDAAITTSSADNILVLCLLILHFVSSCFVSPVFFRLLTFHHHLARHL